MTIAFDRGVRTLLELARARAADHGDSIASTFLLDGERAEQQLTYAELDRRARAIAAALVEAGAAGQRVLILCMPGHDYIAAFFGCLYAGAIAVPAYPPHPAQLPRTLPRLAAITVDAQVKVALTTKDLLAFSGLLATNEAFAAVRWLAVDDLPASAEDGWTAPSVAPDDIAFLQYTSGSTSLPKGVMVSHGNLVHNAQVMNEFLHLTSDEVVVSWLPPFHDMGLIGGILQGMYSASRSIHLSPTAFLQKPLRWLHALSRYRGKVTFAPNFAYDLCAKRVTDEDKRQFDLSGWQFAINGAEPIRAETVERFVSVFAPCGFAPAAFKPSYGLAENTLCVSSTPVPSRARMLTAEARALSGGQVVPAPSGRRLVSSGVVPPLQEVAIADPDSGARRGPHQLGEIWLKGGSVAHGYWNRPDESAHTFQARLADGEGPYLRTGDLGFVDEEGHLFVTGRIKDLIILRGKNHYPQDLELTVENAHPAVRLGCSAAFAVDEGDEERLVLVAEIDKKPDQELRPDEVIAAVRQAVVAQHEVAPHAVALIKPRTIPKTSSGKIQRRATRQAFLSADLELVWMWRASAGDDPLPAEAEAAPAAAPARLTTADEIEAWLVGEMARRGQVPMRQIDPGQPPIRYGVDSIDGVELAMELEQRTGATLGYVDVIGAASLRALAERLARPAPAAAVDERPPLTRVGAQAPLSHGQERFWFVDRAAPIPNANLKHGLRITGRLDTEALERAVAEIVRRHDVLRTTIHLEGGLPVQRVSPSVTVALPVEPAPGVAESDRDAAIRARAAEEQRRPVDFERGPLIRFLLLAFDAEDHGLVLIAHHSIFDGVSIALLTRELVTLYDAFVAKRPSPLPELAAQYPDFAAWQRRWLTGAVMDRYVHYWEEHLRGAPAPVLPADFAEPDGSRTGKVMHAFSVEEPLYRALKDIGAAENATPYVTMVTLYLILLSRLSGERDMVVTFPISDRSRPELQPLIGCFSTALPLRVPLAGDPTFRAVLRSARDAALSGYAHGAITQIELSKIAQRAGFTQRLNPFVVRNNCNFIKLPFLSTEAGGARFAQVLAGGLASVELILLFSESEGGLLAIFEGNADRFLEATLARAARQLCQLAEEVARDPDRAISAYSIEADSLRTDGAPR